jgi:hypothetical protein
MSKYFSGLPEQKKRLLNRDMQRENAQQAVPAAQKKATKQALVA